MTICALAIQPAHNTLTAAEVKAGWKLLFDGKSTSGWKGFRKDTVGSGWKVSDGVLEIADVATAGDIITTDQFSEYELSLDFNYARGQNSGIMFHVREIGSYPWETGPEVQIYDHLGTDRAEITGWLYNLYDCEVSTAKPAGEWNNMRVIISKEKWATYINNTLYYEFVYQSDDFWARVKKTKFADMPNYGKFDSGHIAIQGDHGVVKFRNIKIRPL